MFKGFDDMCKKIICPTRHREINEKDLSKYYHIQLNVNSEEIMLSFRNSMYLTN